ncbi:hypothetical protein [Flavobacterium sp. CAN_S2]|uniref:hypothetical protein n=1 Tax=Flavobacterium sp. CAN_S2 TaxID=2787726 RepID=UPI0018CA1435
MKSYILLILLSVIVIGCQNKDNNTSKIPVTPTIQDTVSNMEESKEKIPDSIAIVESKSTHGLILTSNALQVINKNTGSTSEIPFGKPLDQMIEIINNVLQSKPTTIGINNECGAGPLKMASWNNGLTVVFQNKKSESKTSETNWQFAGWFVGNNSKNSKEISTMAGIGIGSTRSEMESAYVLSISKTSLGYEFSTSSGLFGIFDGPKKEAKITSLWSGLSCNFR